MNPDFQPVDPRPDLPGGPRAVPDRLGVVRAAWLAADTVVTAFRCPEARCLGGWLGARRVERDVHWQCPSCHSGGTIAVPRDLDPTSLLSRPTHRTRLQQSETVPATLALGRAAPRSTTGDESCTMTADEYAAVQSLALFDRETLDLVMHAVPCGDDRVTLRGNRDDLAMLAELAEADASHRADATTAGRLARACMALRDALAAPSR